MRIGVLTLPLHTNYGGILQAYALQTLLERMGHEVVVFDTNKRLKISIFQFPLTFIKRCVKKYLLGKPTRIFYENWYNKTYPIISKYTQEFLDRYIHRFEVLDLQTLSKDFFDVLVVGSDQVWRPRYFSSMYHTEMKNAYLAFAHNWDIKRIAYAPSFGTEEWEYSEKETEVCGNLLRSFDLVTVREQSGVHLCKKYFGINAHHVLDPTMLLNSTDYVQLINHGNAPQSEGNMLCYVLDETEEKTAIIERVAKKKSLNPFRVNSKVEDCWAPIESRIQPSVESWLRGFYDAEFVVTDSFHACVFSILFSKPFLVIGNEGRGLARFKSLLSMFGLQDRLIRTSDLNIELIDIDWDSVHAILDQKRRESMAVLSKSLS